MVDCSNACIYIIKTGKDTYVGSTFDYKKRIRDHNENLYNDTLRDHNIRLYRTIRENNYDWDIKKLHDYPCDTLTELRIEERRVYDELQPTLNERKPYVSADERRQWRENYMKTYYQKYRAEQGETLLEKKRQYYQNNKVAISEKQKIRVICECGELVNKHHISRHRKSKKHIEIMS